FFLQLPPPNAFGELKPIAIGSDHFILFRFGFVTTDDPSGVQNFMPSARPPFRLSPLTIAVTPRPVRSTDAREAYPATTAGRAISPAKLAAPANPPRFPILPWKALRDRQNQS